MKFEFQDERKFANIDNEVLHFTECTEGADESQDPTPLSAMPIDEQELGMGFTNNEDEESDDENSVNGDTADLILRMRDSLSWLDSHISEMASGNNGDRQIRYLKTAVMDRLDRYRTNVERNLDSTSAPRTWSCPDTVFLP